MRRISIAAALFLTPFSALAQQPPAPPETPIFRSGVDLVTLDATVVDDEGKPIEGLGAADFELRVDGRPRTIASAQFVALSNRARAAEDAPRAAHYSTNEDAPTGRLILFAVDREHIRPAEGMAALRSAGRFIDGLHDDDRIAVTGIPRLGAMLDFTTDHTAVRFELERLVGQATPIPVYFNIGLSEALDISEGGRQQLDVAARRECGITLSVSESPARAAELGLERDPCPVQVEQESRAIAQYTRSQARASLAALRGLIESLRSIDQPKTIILISEGLVAEPRFVDFSQLAAAAASARVTIHVLQLETPTLVDAAAERLSPTILQDRFLREDGLARLAGAARGALFPFIGDGSIAFGKIARELSGYYLVGFEASGTERDGRVHRIELKLRQRRALIRARQAFSAGPKTGSQQAVGVQLADLLRSPRLAAELPLRVSTYTYQEPASANLRVVVSAEMARPADAQSNATLAFVLLDTRNVIAASATEVVSNGRHAFSAIVSPGDYTLKVAGIDSLGRRGSVERGFEARLSQAGRLRVSDLLIASPPSSPGEPLHPTIDRTGDGDLVAYLELYADEALPLRQATVRVEVAATEGGPSFVTIPAFLHRRDARWSIARAQVPTGPLPAGRYFVRAQVYLDGQPVKRLVRPFAVERAAEK